MDSTHSLPLWKDIPPVKDMPQGTAWGLFDQAGVKDELGTLNLLTPKSVLQARKEIQTGVSVALNWGLDKIHEPVGGRSAFKHEFVDWRSKAGMDFYSWDDELSFNTQAGSQWDGLRHWGHGRTGLYYNGIHHDEVVKGPHLSIDAWTKRGGIVGRGVLLDYVAYAKRHGIDYDPFSAHAITPAELKAMAKETNVTFQSGDILVVRSGLVKWYDEHSEDERREAMARLAFTGVQGCEETLEFLWNNRIAAVAGDTIAWEVWPGKDPNYALHDWLLALWGMPIGELWDLEKLAEACEMHQRWTFFLTSAPLNVPGGVASPPNAIAIF